MYTKETFLDFYKDFCEKHGRTTLKNPDLWFDKYEKCHQNIKKNLFDDKSEICIDVSKIADKIEIPSVEAQDFAQKIRKIIPSHLINSKAIISGLVRLNKREVRLNKYILKYIRLTKNQISTTQKYTLALLINEIGRWRQEYAQKANKKEFELVFTINPEDLIRIGSHDIDKSSCFGERGHNRECRYILGMIPNTFITLVRDKNTKEVAFRLLSFTDDTLDNFAFTNKYGAPGIEFADFKQFIKVAIENIIEKKTKWQGRCQMSGRTYSHSPNALLTASDSQVLSITGTNDLINGMI